MQLLTDLLELAGLLLIAAGITLALWFVWPPCALAAAGICLIGISYLLTRKAGGIRR